MKKSKKVKMKNAQNMKWWKSWSHFTLKKGGSDFGLKTGSRGTPWNSKNAGPGGSEFTKCRFWSFKWHFGVFRGGSIFDTFFDHFSSFWFCHFFHFCIFLFSVFCHFFTFLDFVTFYIFMFLLIFCHFLLLRWIFDHFCVKFRCLNHDTVFF